MTLRIVSLLCISFVIANGFVMPFQQRHCSIIANDVGADRCTKVSRRNIETTILHQVASSKSNGSNIDKMDNVISANYIYLDIEIASTEIGRLIFELQNPSPLPLHAENLIQLCKGSKRAIDPKAHYINCEFEFSPLYVEGERYRWGHVVKGRGRNAIGNADEAIVDKENQLQSTHSCFGGQYYGVKYSDIIVTEEDANDPGVVLTVPVTGPGFGTSKFSIVRVGESPREWQERLLLNSGVVGRLLPESLPVLHTMARQRQGPPTIVNSGALETL